mmetsp:Transcript_31436/g.48063  ORF Transcript_31436/g.48063 Transcript_31436/m.48063 type:complete len:106 (+) Transcript_31436:480-797(+)
MKTVEELKDQSEDEVTQLTFEFKKKTIYPKGYESRDDLNHDGVIDNLEAQLAVIGRKDEIRRQLTNYLQDENKRAGRKEVDFHHKAAYRFERAYRLVKRHPEKKN